MEICTRDYKQQKLTQFRIILSDYIMHLKKEVCVVIHFSTQTYLRIPHHVEAVCIHSQSHYTCIMRMGHKRCIHFMIFIRSVQ